MNIARSTWLAIAIIWLATFLSHQLMAADFQVEDHNLEQCLRDIASSRKWSQPSEFTEIECHSKGVKSLRGLEHFQQLEILSIYNNKLQQVDIDLAKLKNLKMLNLARNNLEHLVVADMANLKSVYVFVNRIKTLKLTNLRNLQTLKVNNNKIETFNYLNTPLLSKIYIFNNQLETINIHELPALQYMDCRENPMPDELYDEMDQMETITFLHDGNAEDW
ncbi:MAG: leucine-rich repeat domain-containing protein [Gammaproteobacteria bacterium]